MNILIINAEDFGGGANKIAISLLRSYNESGHRAKLLVREKNCNNPNIISVNNDDCRNFLWQSISVLQKKLLNNNVRYLPKFLQYLKPSTEPKRTISNLLGLEDFEYPGFVKTLKKIQFQPDIIHCHNLHSDFFDLRILKKLSNSVPLFITLHDCWMLTGHCVYPYECRKWKTTCRKCPYPKRTIQTKRDASTVNQWRKRQIYRKSKLHISAPSIWLRKMAEKSILKEGAIEFRTIPNGVDVTVFNPGCKIRARTKIGLCQTKKIILFAAGAASKNPAKGWNNLLNLLNYAKNKKSFPETVILILGDSFKDKIYGNITLKSINWISSEKELVNYYRASDLYLHLANAENFPLSILEAMHCNLPVIGSEIGGIPEQIKYGYNGFYFHNENIDSICECFSSVLENDHLLKTLGKNSKKRAMEKFTLSKMTNKYLEWFQEVIEQK